MHAGSGKRGKRSIAQTPDNTAAVHAHVSILGIETIDPKTLPYPEWYPKDARARKVFRDLAANVARAMALQTEHADMIATCATDMLEVGRLREYIGKHGYTYQIKTQSGDYMYRERVEVRNYNVAMRRIQVCMMEFGLTPLAWARNIAKAVKDGLIVPQHKKAGTVTSDKFRKFRRT